jgi:hypothetical protein
MSEPDPEEPALVRLPLFRGKVRFNRFDRQLIDTITKVRSGDMTPDAAEAWAEEHGYSSFVFRPSDEESVKALKERCTVGRLHRVPTLLSQLTQHR